MRNGHDCETTVGAGRALNEAYFLPVKLAILCIESQREHGARRLLTITAAFMFWKLGRRAGYLGIELVIRIVASAVIYREIF